MKQLSKIKSLLQSAFWLKDVKVKMEDSHSLIVDIPCTRWNNDCHKEFFITPNKIQDLIKAKLNQHLTIIMIM